MSSLFFKSLLGTALSLNLLTYPEITTVNPVTREAVEVSHDKKAMASALSVEEMMLMYIDCDHKTYSQKGFQYTKTAEEVSQGAVKRQNLENLLINYFNEEKIKRGLPDDPEEIYDPLDGKGNFENGFNDFRYRLGKYKETHEGIDIFAKLGSEIFAPVSGVVVASSDDWTGHLERRKGFIYDGGGLSALSGNGVILFNPNDRSYYFLIHMKDVLVKTGDVVSRGTVLGTVGKTGNARNTPPHLHEAWKKQGGSCGRNDVLVAQNPYPYLIAARRIFMANNQDK